MSNLYTYVALLRGINVGGNNLIKMVELKKCLEDAGYGNVTTYIASGNVVFTSPESNAGKLESHVEERLSKTFSYKARVMIRSYGQMKAVVEEAPEWFGKDKLSRYNVLFLKKPAKVEDVLAIAPPRDGVDRAVAGKDAVYYSTLFSAATRSYLPRIIGTPEYQYVTIRTFGTVQKLLALMEKAAA
jgi:uncharacterized protein (DUF1697 family)